MVNTGAVRTWLELSSSADEAQAQAVESTARAGEKWAGLGVRVNSVLQTTRSALPRVATMKFGFGYACLGQAFDQNPQNGPVSARCD